MSYYYAMLNDYYINYLNVGSSNQLRLRDYKSEIHGEQMKKDMWKLKLVANAYGRQFQKLEELKRINPNQVDMFEYKKVSKKYKEFKSNYFDIVNELKKIKKYMKDCIVYNEAQINMLKIIHPDLVTKVYKLSNNSELVNDN